MVNITFLDRDSFQVDITIRPPNFEHHWRNYATTTADKVIEHCGDSHIILTNKVAINRATLEACPNIKHIAVTATGYNIVDLDACRDHGVSVSNIPNYASTTVPEHVLACTISLRRRLSRYQQQVINGAWQQSDRFCLFDQPIHDLRGATFGVIGFGALGQATAALMHAIGMRVIYSSQSPKNSEFAEPVNLSTLLSQADIISLHCPLTPETKGLIGNTELSQMKSSAILINTARGGIVEENALVDAIEQQQIAGAAIDVLHQEPPTDDSSPLFSPLFNLAQRDNVILTPHIAWASQEAMQALSEQLIDNIEAFQTGQAINLVSDH